MRRLSSSTPQATISAACSVALPAHGTEWSFHTSRPRCRVNSALAASETFESTQAWASSWIRVSRFKSHISIVRVSGLNRPRRSRHLSVSSWNTNRTRGGTSPAARKPGCRPETQRDACRQAAARRLLICCEPVVMGLTRGDPGNVPSAGHRSLAGLLMARPAGWKGGVVRGSRLPRRVRPIQLSVRRPQLPRPDRPRLDPGMGTQPCFRRRLDEGGGYSRHGCAAVKCGRQAMELLVPRPACRGAPVANGAGAVLAGAVVYSGWFPLGL
jgi:hypothetical protein